MPVKVPVVVPVEVPVVVRVTTCAATGDVAKSSAVINASVANRIAGDEVRRQSPARRMDKIEAAQRAVDMPLRLDNANALPTYPQQKQKQKQQEAA